jgi:hypothetical protein
MIDNVQTSGVSLINLKKKTVISNDRQCSNKLNKPMTCNPQLRCKLCPINNIATKKIFYIQTKTDIYRQKQNKTKQNKTKQVNKQTNKTDKVFVHTPKLK